MWPSLDQLPKTVCMVFNAERKKTQIFALTEYIGKLWAGQGLTIAGNRRSVIGRVHLSDHPRSSRQR